VGHFPLLTFFFEFSSMCDIVGWVTGRASADPACKKLGPVIPKAGPTCSNSTKNGGKQKLNLCKVIT